MYKKILILLFGLFMTVPMFINAEKLTCTYIRPYSGDNKSKKNISFNIEFNPIKVSNITNKVEVKIINSSSDYTIKQTDEATSGTDYWNLLNPYIDTTDKNNLKMKECPDLWFKEDEKKKIISLFASSQARGNGIGQTITLNALLHASSDGNVITGDKTSNLQKTSCTLQASYMDISTKENSTYSSRTLSFNIDSYEDGSVYVSYGNQGGYLNKTTNDSNIALQFEIINSNFYKETIKIFNDDVDKIKDKYPYGDTTCGALVITKFGNGKEYALSTETRTDLEGYTSSATVSKDYTIDTDPRLKIDANISTKSSTCEQLLGGKNSNLIKYLQSAWTIVKIGAIIITIIMAIIDFMTVITKEKDELKECLNKNIKRLIIVIIILLMPTIIDFIGETIFNSPNVLCGIK